MRKTRQMPTRSQVAQRVAALTMLASFAACSHGGEPRHPLTKDTQQNLVGTSASGSAAARPPATNQVKHGVVRTAEAVPAPEAVFLGPVSSTADPEAAGPMTGHRSRPAAPVSSTAEPDATPMPADPHLQNASTPPLGIAPVVVAPVKALPTAPQMRAQGEAPAATYWPLYAGAGIAGVSVLALMLLRRRDRKAAQGKRDAERARELELEREAAIAQEAAARQEQERHAAQVAAAAAAAEEASLQAAEQARAQAALATAARERAEQKADPRIAAAHRLFDLLHRAERDVEPFMRLLDEAAPSDASTNSSRHVVASWHESMLSTRNRLSEALVRYQAPVDMQVVEPAEDLQSAMGRLIDHAARMSALMVSQQQENSAILHWSRQLPGALVQLFWRAQTARYSSTMPQLPKVPDAPAPGAIGTTAPAQPSAPAQTVRTHDRAIQKALRGGSSHVVSA